MQKPATRQRTFQANLQTYPTDPKQLPKEFAGVQWPTAIVGSDPLYPLSRRNKAEA